VGFFEECGRIDLTDGEYAGSDVRVDAMYLQADAEELVQFDAEILADAKEVPNLTPSGGDCWRQWLCFWFLAEIPGSA
jgi:hypothetical protein